MKLTTTLLALGGLALGVSAANATVVSIGDNPGASAHPTLNTSYGTLEAAVNLGQTGGGTTAYSGLTFTNNSATDTGSVTYGTFGTITLGATSTGATAIGTAGGIATGPIYDTESWSNANQPITLNITGLNAALTYHIQVLNGETRGFGDGIDFEGTVTATTDSDSDVLTYAFGSESDSPDYNIVTLVVSGTTSVDVAYSAPMEDRGPSMSGVVIQSVPEPSTALLGALGLLGLLRRNRK